MIMVYDAPAGTKMFLKLIQDGRNAALILVDEDGDKVEAGNVLTISDEGVTFHASINRAAPFRMTGEREIYNCDR